MRQREEEDRAMILQAQQINREDEGGRRREKEDGRGEVIRFQYQ